MVHDLPIWSSEERWSARGLLLAVIALNLGIVYINVLLNKWNTAFYDALQDKDYTVFLHQLIRFSWLAGLFIVFAVPLCLLHDPDEGDGPWSLGCRAYERICHAIRKASLTYNWLKILPEKSSLGFSFAIGNVHSAFTVVRKNLRPTTNPGATERFAKSNSVSR